jgi:hypothetical protein
MLAALEDGIKADILPHCFYSPKNPFGHLLRPGSADTPAEYFTCACPYYDDLPPGHFADLDKLAQYRLDIGADPDRIRLFHVCSWTR